MQQRTVPVMIYLNKILNVIGKFKIQFLTQLSPWNIQGILD